MKKRTVSIVAAVLAVGIIGVFAVSRIQTKADTVPVMDDSLETAQGDVVEEPEQTEETAPVETEQDSTKPEETDVVEEEPDTAPIDEALTDITVLDKIMYATSAVNTRSGPSTEYERVGGLTTNEEVHVIGRSNITAWYQIDVDGVTQFVSNNYLAYEKVEEQPAEQQSVTQVEQSVEQSTQNAPVQNSEPIQQDNDAIDRMLGLPEGSGSLNWDGTIFEGYGTSDLPDLKAE